MTNTIAFPMLGLSMEVNRVAFTLFEKNVFWYGIIIALGFTLGVLYALYRAEKVGLTKDNVFDLALIGLPLSVVCARLFYVLGDPSVLEEGIWKIFAIWEGGIAIYGALIGCALTGIIYSSVKKIHLGRLCDLAAPSLMIGQIIGRWGNFVNCEVFGRTTQVPWGMQINGGEAVHPLFLYESLWMLLGLVLLLFYQDKKRRYGEVFCLYLIWYSVARAFLETLRDPEYILRVFNLPLSMITAFVLLAAAITVLGLLYAKGKRVNLKKDIVGAQVEQRRQTLNALLDANADEKEVLEASESLDKKIAEYMEL